MIAVPPALIERVALSVPCAECGGDMKPIALTLHPEWGRPLRCKDCGHFYWLKIECLR